MVRLKKLRLYVLSALLLCTTTALGQSFGDRVYGDAVSCKQKPYDISGSPGNYTIHGSATAPACKGAGSATASSSAKVGPPEIGAKMTTTTSKAGDGGVSSATSTDEAILTPPAGWLSSVPVKLRTIYDFGVKGVKSKTAAGYSIAWVVTSGGVKKVNHQVGSTSNGHGEQKLAFGFKVDQDTNGYSFSVNLYGGTSAVATKYGAPSAHFVTFPIHVILPQGWTCQWLSTLGPC